MSSTPSADAQLQLEGLDPLENRDFMVLKRDRREVPFDESLIFTAIERAFGAEHGLSADETFPAELAGHVLKISNLVTENVLDRAIHGELLEVEKVQDEVEAQLMKAGFYTIARRYIVYREEHRRARALSDQPQVREQESQRTLTVTNREGISEPLDADRIRREIAASQHGFEGLSSASHLIEEILKTLYDGMPTREIPKAMIMAAKSQIERDPAYSYVASRLLLKVIYREALGAAANDEDIENAHRRHFVNYLDVGIKNERLSPDLLSYDLDIISGALDMARDQKFNYIGLQTIYDRYLIHLEGRRIETPQYFWMRVAMGLALHEGDAKEERAVEFYNMLSSFHFISSTPTLFNAGTTHPQLSSCYLSTIMDSLDHIFKVISDDARLSKWAGGLGNDWTSVRAIGAYIKGTNGESQGIIPFLKVANDTAVAVNQGGKRKGAMCAYLETWHLDIEDFLELRKNTGDDRRRTHDMNTANWIPDLFMKRVAEGRHWTLFSPDEVPDLHDRFGRDFENRYVEYEAMAEEGKLHQHRKIEATDLWRKMLSMLYETGHPWLTFKDPSNIRSPQGHTGVVHSSNLCTEILLNTSEDETAVCNLGSINLRVHIRDGKLDETRLARTIRTAVRMLDNVIDINYYPTPEAKTANLRHRPIGLGMMGFQDALYSLDISYASQAAVDFSDRSMELISYNALLASSELAAERGTYKTYPGSKWDQGLLPIDTLKMLEDERGSEYLDIDTSSSLDWDVVRDAIRTHGLRNSNTMAIAPTATISNITGVTQSIEPSYKNLFTKSNLSGEFTTVNTYLVNDLKALDLWNDEMLDDLKYFDGSLLEIERVPEHLRKKYLTAFEIESKWLIECASRRQKWIDMGQSLNLYIEEPSGRKLSEMYMMAWRKGLKTTYYLRSVAATQIEKSTVDINKRGIQPRWMKNRSASSSVEVLREVEEPATVPQACSILDPTCEACQ